MSKHARGKPFEQTYASDAVRVESESRGEALPADVLLSEAEFDSEDSPPDADLDEAEIESVEEQTGEDDQIDDPVRIYLMQMGEIPLLKPREELAAAKRIKIARKRFRQ
jgi:hypothetical protein